MFSFRYDAKENILHWKMWGFWTIETAQAFAAAMRSHVAAIPGGHLSFDGLGDAREFPVQSTEVAEAIPRLLPSGKNEGPRRTAIVVRSALSKMQAGRNHESRRVRTFLSVEEALAWLRDRQQEIR